MWCCPRFIYDRKQILHTHTRIRIQAPLFTMRAVTMNVTLNHQTTRNEPTICSILNTNELANIEHRITTTNHRFFCCAEKTFYAGNAAVVRCQWVSSIFCALFAVHCVFSKKSHCNKIELHCGCLSCFFGCVALRWVAKCCSVGAAECGSEWE